ncbi:MAG: TIGR02099 family protein [Methylococcaceae bacterium]|nr:TIGR02099 family protein [Methylococcaceae bacterium]
MIHHITFFTRHLLFWSLIFFAISLSSIRLFILGVEGYKTDLENKIYELTSISVEIGILKANMRGIDPEVILKKIKIASESDQPIQLEEVRVGLSLVKLLFTRQILPSSRLTLVGAKLSIIRNKDGSLSVVGLNGDNSEQPLWLLHGGQYEVLKSEITWLDKTRKTQPITFKNVDLLIKNNRAGRTHELHLVSQLPEQYGDNIRVSMDIQGDVLEFEKLDGRVYVEAEDVFFSEVLNDYLHTNLDLAKTIKITDGEVKGKGNLKIWSHWKQSKMTVLAGIVQVEDIILDKHDKTIDIKSLNTEFIGSTLADGWKFSVNRCNLKTKNHHWPDTEFSFSSNKDFTHLTTLITQLDLHELTELIGFFSPFEKKQQELIADLGIKGVIKNFSIDANLKSNRFSFKGDFDNFFTYAHLKIPQIENLTGSVWGNNDQGKISLNTKKGAIYFPELFRQPLLIDNLYGQIEWQQKQNKWKVQSKSLVVENKDIQTETRLALTIPKSDQSIFMDLQTSFANVKDVSSLSTYYPVGIMKRKSIKWLDKAFVSGNIKKGGLLVYGEMKHFPFLGGEGVFEALFNASDVELNFSPDWPNLTHGAANILFLKNGLEVEIDHAKLGHLKVSNAAVKVSSFKKSNHFFVKGNAEGRIADALSFLQQTPVNINQGVDEFVDAIDSKGNAKVEIDLKVPMKKHAVPKVKGVAHFNNANLSVKSVNLNIEELTGNLSITEKGLFSNNLTAKTLGYPIGITVDYDELKTSINIKGVTDSQQLKKQFDFLDKDFIKDNPVSGSTPYNIIVDLLSVENISPEINLKSSLTGMLIELPGGLQKTVEQEKTLLVNMTLKEGNFFPLNINYNDEIIAAVRFNKQEKLVHSAQIVYGQHEALAPEQKGMNIRIDQESIDASEWLPFVTQLLNNKQRDENSKEGSELELNKMSLKAGQLLWKGKEQGTLELELKNKENQWNGNILSSIVKGAFVIPHQKTKKDKISLKLDRLDLSGLVQLNKGNSDEIKEQDMPVVELVSQHLLWNKVDLGVLKIESERVVDGVRFNKIDVTSNNLKIKLKANWIKLNNYNGTELSGTVSSGNFGKLLSQLDITDDLKDAQGTVDINAEWRSLPYHFSFHQASAGLGLQLKEGRISSIEPGIGRFLGLVAMEQWLKRLKFDYGDMYKQGLSFNKITGSFKINNGIMTTHDLLIDAIPAIISMKGEVDLLNKTLDHKVKVVPKSSAAIPIAGTIVGGIAGAITQALDKDYKDGYFFGSNYSIAGQWDNIKVTPLYAQDGIFNKTWSGLTNSTTQDKTIKSKREKR